MKSLIIILFASSFILSVTAQDKGPKFEDINIKTSAQCDECKMRIEKVLVWEPSIKSANLNVETKIVTVKYKPKKITPDEIRRVIADVGYDADDMTADKEAYDILPGCCKKDGKHSMGTGD